MKKTFSFVDGDKNKDRILDGIKNEVRKYVKRENKKKLPEDCDFWDMQCKFAKGDNTPEVIKFVDITKCIDDAAQSEFDTFYLEIISSPTQRRVREKRVRTDEE